MSEFDESESDENGFIQMFSDQLDSASHHIDEITVPQSDAELGPGSIPESENYGEISFTMKFDLEATSKSGENRLLINVAECRHIPRHPLISHPYVKG